ncbi:hypothetical protein [Streptomyces virginiae]|uniref:hypothetical protein n=1 Tax=Streptomyces virginiae TaxID=1961 RepID=UPI0022566B46|nr:hypothetical protein [Streptomyces virginiae]MCX5275195.1 hypothetical protein [Streptomyces virginiae]
MDMPEEAWEREAPHLREIVLFLSVHLDRAPGVLWPEYDNPAFGDVGDGDDIGDGDGDDADELDDAGAGPAGGGVCPTQVDRFTAELASLTGLSVRLDRVETVGAVPGVGGDAAWTGSPGVREHLLIQQIAGAVTWQLTGTGESGRSESFQCRLLPGELLYVPSRWSRRCVGAPEASYAVICLGDQED